MRISSANQPVVLKTEMKAKNADLPIGKIVKGQVLALDGKLATLLVDGKTLAVELPESYKGATGDVLKFEVTDIKDQTVLATLVDESSNESTNVFAKLGMTKPTALDQQVVELMKSLKLPMDKATFEDLKSSLKDLQMAEKLSPILVKEGETLKEAVIRTLKTPVETQTKVQVQVISSKDAPVQTTNANQSEVVPNKVDGQVLKETLNQDVAVENVLVSEKEQVSSIKEGTLIPNEGKNVEIPVKENQNSLSDQRAVSDKVDVNIEPKHLALMVKEKLPMVLKNLMSIDQVMKGEKLLAKHIDQLIQKEDVLERVGFNVKDLLDGVKQGDIKLFDDIKTALETLKQTPQAEQLVDIDLVEKDITMIQEIIQVSRDINQDILYMDMPILFRDNVESLTLMAKKKGGKLNKDEIRLYLALDTINYDKVRTIIDYDKNRVGIQFRLESEEAIKAFEEVSEDLRVSVEAFEDGKVVSVAVSRYHDSLPLDDIEPEGMEYHQLDMKV